MSSESESFLGMKDSQPLPERKPAGILSKRRVWILTLLISYLFSAVWLSGVIVCVPYVIWMAPLGFTALFDPPSDGSTRVSLHEAEYVVHLVFWALFFTGLFGCKKLSLRMLRYIFAGVLLMLVLTMYGCATHYAFKGGF